VTRPSVLVLHAAGLDTRSVDFLGVEGAISPTLPGHGDRRRPRPGMSLLDMADEVAGWVTGPVDVVGLSMGGMVAMHLALEYPDRVRSLLLACTTARTPTEVLLERAAATEVASDDELVTTTLRRWFTADYLARTPEPAPLAYARNCLTRIDHAAYADVWRAIAGHDVLDRLGEIGVPTTCLAGTRDVSTPPAELEVLATGVPGARLVEIDAPHMAPLEQPEQFRRVVLEHLEWVRTRGSS
jgi:pimeloyl-ACP methyl ester carboxylesterase